MRPHSRWRRSPMAAKKSPADIGPPVVAHRYLLALLRSPMGGLFGGFCELHFLGRISGRQITLPAQCAEAGDRLVIYVSRSADKQWWRNFINGHEVQVRVRGVAYIGRGIVVGVDHRDRDAAQQCYEHRYPKVHVLRSEPMVVIDLAAHTSASER